MPNWEQPFDIYNNFNCTDNFNPFNVTCITKSMMEKYFPLEDCFICKVKNEDPLKFCYSQLDKNGHPVCKLRLKDYTNSGSLVVQTRGLGKEGDKESLWIRSGNMAWLYKNKIKCIYRPSNENRTMLHHISGNPFNNKGINCAIIDFHEDLHGQLRSISTSIAKLLIIASGPRVTIDVARDVLYEIKRLQRVYKKAVYGVKDSTRVFQIIEIIYSVMNGNTSTDRAQLKLEALGAAYPPGFQENVDLRSLRKTGQQIIDLNHERKIKKIAI